MVQPNGVNGFDEVAPLTDQWSLVAASMADAIADAVLANTPVRTRSGEQPFSALVEGLLMTDTLCHTWDLARAVGASDELDADAVAKAHDILIGMGDAIRVAGGFAAPIASGAGADAQTTFLNFAGHDT